QIPQYIVETDILIKDNKSSGSETDLLQSLNVNSSSKVIDNEIEILKSNSLMEKVVNDLNLQNSYFIKNRISQVVIYRNLGYNIELLKVNANTYSQPWSVKVISKNQAIFNGQTLTVNRPVQTDAGLIMITTNNSSIDNRLLFVNFNTTENAAQSFIANLSIVAATKDATVLLIKLQDANVDRGKDVLNKLVEEYNQAGIDDKNVTTANQLVFLKGRIDSLAVELSTVEKNVQDYKSANKITDMTAESAAFLTAVQTNDQALTQLNLQIGSLKNLESYLSSPNTGQAKLPAMLGIADPTLLTLVQQLGEAQLRKQSLLRTIPETNPVISSINDQIGALRQTITQTVQNLKNSLLESQKQLQAKSAQFEATVRSVPSIERGLIDVMREQDIKNTLFTYLLQKREETALSLASTIADSRTINKARGSYVPIKPVKSILYLTFLLLGLIVPFGAITGKEALNVRVRKRIDIEKYTDTPILADISQVTGYDPLIVVSKPRSMIAEQIRALRSNLPYVIPESSDKVLLFTSSISGEGKSFVSLNLGASLATTGKKVIILELDLRKPKLNIALGIDNQIGLSNYLIGQYDYKDIVKLIPQQENYSIITCGPHPPNPAELLLNGRIELLIEQLKKDYDYIILDAPPVGLVTDAQILAQWANATFYIVRYNYTYKAQIPVIDDLRQKALFRNLNIIFNGVDFSAGGIYGYGYGYGYGYYSDDKPKKKSILNLFKK
ncbi:exopolysaccharide transport family protein, partial [Mucilaginibacter sp.]